MINRKKNDDLDSYINAISFLNNGDSFPCISLHSDHAAFTCYWSHSHNNKTLLIHQSIINLDHFSPLPHWPCSAVNHVTCNKAADLNGVSLLGGFVAVRGGKN